MGESCVYYVPEDQEAWSGRSDELAEKLCHFGIFLETSTILERLAEYSSKNSPLPECQLQIDELFGSIDISDELENHPVPNQLYDIRCPSCSADVTNETYDEWSSESNLPLSERKVFCSACKTTSSAKAMTFGEPMTFARFYVFVSDCDKERWDPNFRLMLEKIFGPCLEFWEWAT